MSEFIYYAKHEGDEDWQETVVLESPRKLADQELTIFVEELKALGMIYRRVWEYRGEAPDFAGTVRI